MKEPTKRILILVVVVAVVGGGWWYFSKRSACEGKISYTPSGEFRGAFYQLCSGIFDTNCPKFATHAEALSACMWR